MQMRERRPERKRLAAALGANYLWIVKEPGVNLQENIGKTVGRARPIDYDQLVEVADAIMPRLPFPKGVYRFKSFEEANEWTEKHILAAAIKKLAARQKEKTCEESARS
jgi:hypothetical protein